VFVRAEIFPGGIKLPDSKKSAAQSSRHVAKCAATRMIPQSTSSAKNDGLLEATGITCLPKMNFAG